MRSEFCPVGTNWPEWAIYIVGIAGGFQCFESEDEGVKWLAEYHEREKAEPKPERKRVESRDDEEPVRKVIAGFAA